MAALANQPLGSAEFEGTVCFRSTSMTTLVGWGRVEGGGDLPLPLTRVVRL